jgi:hypothetical protein
MAKMPLGPPVGATQRVWSNRPAWSGSTSLTSLSPLTRDQTLTLPRLSGDPASPPTSPDYPGQFRPSPPARLGGSEPPLDGGHGGPRRSNACVLVHSSPTTSAAARVDGIRGDPADPWVFGAVTPPWTTPRCAGCCGTCRSLAWLGQVLPSSRRAPPWPPWPRLLPARPGTCATLLSPPVPVLLPPL